MPVKVQISAHRIEWPGQCACCCSEPGTARLEVESKRVTGVNVIRTQTKSWEVPYCLTCLRHVREILAFAPEYLDAKAEREKAEARAKEEAREAVENELMRAQAVQERPKLVLGCGIAGIAILFMVTATILGFVLHEQLGLLVFCLLLAGGAAVLGAGIVGLARNAALRVAAEAREEIAEKKAAGLWPPPPPPTPRYLKEARARARRAEEKMQEIQGAMRPACCTMAPAVEYQGWHGSVHTFVFENEGYAAAFRDANPGKCL